ncbi:MAG TPA: tetratricopeptide repeat protein [Anaerolineae bacterium]|nr:tetratricopeptide repeat protein [Anaerolineae bacterium]
MDQFALDHANFSCLLWENGDHTRAVQEMVQARDLDPDNGLYHLNLGRYLEAQGRYVDTWDEYARSLSCQPVYLRSGYWQQTELRREHRPTILAQAMDRLAKGSPSLRQAYLYTLVGDFPEAWRVYEALLQTAGASDRVRIGRAEVLLARGKPDQALAELEAAIALNPQAAWDYYYRGAIYLKQNRLHEAAQNTEAALFLASEPAFYYQSGQIARLQGDIQKALRQYEAAVARAAFHFSTRYAVEVAKRPPLAEECLPCLTIPRVTDDLVLPTLAEGELLKQEGQWLAAAQVHRRLLTYEPDETRVKEKLEQLCRQHPEGCPDGPVQSRKASPDVYGRNRGYIEP